MKNFQFYVRKEIKPDLDPTVEVHPGSGSDLITVKLNFFVIYNLNIIVILALNITSARNIQEIFDFGDFESG